MTGRAPELKILAQTAGSAVIGGPIAALLVWVLGVTVWGVPNTGERASDAIAAVPWPVAALLGVAVTNVAGFVAGYWAPHTLRYPTIPVITVDPTAIDPDRTDPA